jgi:hypothetical protein
VRTEIKNIARVSKERDSTLSLETTYFLFIQATKLVTNLEEGIYRFRSRFFLIPIYGSSV